MAGLRPMNNAEVMAVRKYIQENFARVRRNVTPGNSGGAFGVNDPNSFPPNLGFQYDESQVYNPTPIELGTEYKNRTSFTAYTFTIANTSTLILPQNDRRNFLAVQNQDSAADLYINFDGAAGVGQGIKLIAGGNFVFDVVTPRNGVYAFFNNASAVTGIVIEGIMLAE